MDFLEAALNEGIKRNPQEAANHYLDRKKITDQLHRTHLYLEESTCYVAGNYVNWLVSDRPVTISPVDLRHQIAILGSYIHGCSAHI